MSRILLFPLLFLCVLAHGQQQKSKSNSADKIYDKGEGNSSLTLVNARSINSEQLDFSPAFYQNGIVYVTSRQKQGAVDNKIQETFFELYYAEIDGAGNPLKPQKFSPLVNSRAHEGPVTFSRRQDRMYFTRNNLDDGIRKADNKGVTRLKIYEATRGRYDWENVRELPFNSDTYSTMHPTLAPDGKRLFFSSDMPGGYGGYDLYMVERTTEGWSEPVNLGQGVNTDKNEVFPFVHESETLFFSSNGHPGAGGLDIFRIDISGNQWGKVVNLRTPFNSASDDLGFILDKEGKRAYLTSDRAGGRGKDDIYFVNAPFGLDGVQEEKRLVSRVVAFDKQSNDRLDGATVHVFTKGENGLIEGNDYYEVDLQPGQGSGEELTFKLKRRASGDFGEPNGTTNVNGEAILNLPTGRNYLILVQREGYELGEMLYSTVGETKKQTIRVPLVAADPCTPVTGVLRAGTQRLRDVQVLVEALSGGERFTTTTNEEGQFAFCLPADRRYRLTGKATGHATIQQPFSTATVPEFMDLDAKLESPTEIAPLPGATGPLAEGSVILLENIYYDFNKSAIRTGDTRELDALVRLMQQYPDMKIELGAHTDSRGKADYNLKLSQERADNAKQYLTGRGIRADRITARGFGETRLRNDCGDNCSERDHAYNRRTEVRVLKVGDANLQIRNSAGDPFGRQ